MSEFKRKIFGKTTEYLKKNAIPLSALGISAANLYLNFKRDRKKKDPKDIDREERHIDALNRISDSLEKKSDAKFKPKKFSITGYAAKGATIGGAIGTILSAVPSINKNFGGAKTGQGDRRLLFAAGATVIGASLGALAGMISEGADFFDRNKTVRSGSLLPDVIQLLKYLGAKEGKDYTLDPGRADFLKTKVCISLSKRNGDTKILINTKSDPGLDRLLESITRSLPKRYVTSKNASDRFNDLSVTVIGGNVDRKVLAGVIIKFIREGYPVYLIEAGV